MEGIDDKEASGIALADQTGALLMLNKKERKLLKELLTMNLKSKSKKDSIAEKLGGEYIEIAENLLKGLGGTEIR